VRFIKKKVEYRFERIEELKIDLEELKEDLKELKEDLRVEMTEKKT
jgi:hypothetical protein